MLINLDKISPLPSELNDFLEKLATNCKIEKIIVFGSRAFGDYETYSDLDLAIDAPTMEPYEWLQLREYVVYDLNVLIRVSIVDYSHNPDRLKKNIDRTGVLIYER